ncbi:reverse transcriptase domain-containing protein [Tanacetum coccineum]|uniref:Reverse transcriptase domain-containing protein n=1 Tax=Tanacetum coccineum TaxID=301880 RepID=A0ABQ4X0P8_9ASTR
MIQDLETKFGRISDHQSSRPTGTLLSNTQTNPKPSTSNDRTYRPPPARNKHVNAIFTRSGKTYDLPINQNSKTAIFLDDSKDETDEVEKGAEPLPKKPTRTDPPPLKAYKPKIIINLMPYSLYAALSGTTLKPMRMSIRLANHTYQYPMGVAENMLVQVGKFVFPVDFVILQMEEDDRVLLILGRPFLHTTDAIIRVKKKELNLGVREDRVTFLINKAMQHSHSNDDTCFRIDVIDELTEKELDALLDNSKPFLSTSEKINETMLDKEFDEFMSRNVQEDEVKDDFEELRPKDELRIKTAIQDPLTDLEMKPLPKHLEYDFLEENSLLSVVISALLEKYKRERLVSVLKNHKEPFAWKTSDIPGISPSFFVKKEIIKLLNAGIIYAIKDSPWVSPVHCVPKKGGMTVVTNEDNELVLTRTVTGWRVGDKVLLYNSKYKFKAPKLRSKWHGPFVVKHGYPSGYVELYDKHGGSFIANGHRVQLYHDEEQLNKLTKDEIHLMCEEEKMKAIPYIYSVVENTCNEAKLYDLDET